METTHHPIALSPVRDLERNAFVYLKPDSKDGEIYIEKENGDTDIVTPLTKADAVALIAGLKEAFGIRDTEDELRRLLQMREDNVENFIESFTVTVISNIMYENGLQTAVLTPSRILSGMTPNVDIDNTVLGAIKYTLQGEPLNVPANTNDVSAAD
ncbi:TPA: hypothetical protein ACGCAJ_004738 [Serratia marcescens]